MSALFNIPNILTFSRVLTIPVIIYLDQKGSQEIVLTLLGLSLITDFFDGYLARKLGQETHFGAIADPIADKIVAFSYYTYLMLQGLVPLWFGALIILRNFSQFLSLPILILWLKRSFFVRPKKLPKWASALTDIGLIIPFIWGPALFSKQALPFLIGLGLIETYILFTYIPRLIAIAKGEHDTFE